MADERHGVLEAARKEYQAQASARGGRLGADEFVTIAAEPDNPAHAAFEWDDGIAGQKYRIDQARHIIRSIRVESTTLPHLSVIAYVRDPAAAAGTQGYVATATLRNEHDLAREALRDEVLRASAAMRRAREVAIALDLVGDVDAILASLAVFESRVSGASDEPSSGLAAMMTEGGDAMAP